MTAVVEELALFNNFQYTSSSMSQCLPENTTEMKNCLYNPYETMVHFYDYFKENQELIEPALDQILEDMKGIELSNNIKRKIHRAVKKNVEDASRQDLLKVFYTLPKHKRIPIGFFINHLIR